MSSLFGADLGMRGDDPQRHEGDPLLKEASFGSQSRRTKMALALGHRPERIVTDRGDGTVVIATRGIQTVVEPGVRVDRADFVRDKPRFSVGLDGYIIGPPWRDPVGGYANFNHHEGVDKIATDSTCRQVYTAIQLGLFDTFKKNGKPFLIAFVNDCDQDVCLAHWLLHNYDLVAVHRGAIYGRIRDLVDLEDRLDRTGGALPMSPRKALVQKMAWIFEPYMEARVTGVLNHTTPASTMADIICEVSDRISLFVFGKGRKIKLSARYNLIGKGEGYMIIKEAGPYARSRLFAQGVQAVVTVAFNDDGSFRYTIARTAFSHFPLEEVVKRCNAEEGLQEGSDNCWGGGNLHVGSPLQTGSWIPPLTLQQIIDEEIEKAKKADADK